MCPRRTVYWGMCILSLFFYEIRFTLTLALSFTTARPANHACLHHWNPLIWVLLPVEFFNLRRLNEYHVTAAFGTISFAHE